MTLSEGWLDNLRLRDYLKIPALSSSGLKSFRRSPAHHRHDLDNPRPETDALRVGTAIHTAILEPGFMEEYVVLEGCSGRYASGKKAGQRCINNAKIARGKKGFCGTHDPKKGTPSDALPLSLQEYGRVCGARDAVRFHPTAAGMLLAHDGRIERTGVFLDDSGVWGRFRPDRLVKANGVRIHADLKSTRDASPKAFERSIVQFGYIHQAAWYRRGLAALGTDCEASVIVAVESQPPHGVSCFLLAEEDLRRAHVDTDRLLREYARCLERDEWPAYPDGLREIKLPEWAFWDALAR